MKNLLNQREPMSARSSQARFFRVSLPQRLSPLSIYTRIKQVAVEENPPD